MAWVSGDLSRNGTPELVSVDEHAALTVGAELAGDHFYRHPDLDLLIIDIRKLSGHHRALFQLDQGDGVRRALFIPDRGIGDFGKRVNLTPAAELEQITRFLSAARTNVSGREDLLRAGRAAPPPGG